jgi:hypothetical protein
MSRQRPSQGLSPLCSMSSPLNGAESSLREFWGIIHGCVNPGNYGKFCAELTQRGVITQHELSFRVVARRQSPRLNGHLQAQGAQDTAETASCQLVRAAVSLISAHGIPQATDAGDSTRQLCNLPESDAAGVGQ